MAQPKRTRNQPPELSTEAAEAAGLRYVSDAEPGIRRKRAGKGFRLVGPDGQPVRDPATLARIKALAIPPAWASVWVCPDPSGHIQATGRDARGRKQYRYHPRWRAVRDETKYDRMLAFGQALPRIRARTEQDLARPGLPREKVLATVVRLLEATLIRIGNQEYARANRSFGLTTMRDRHVDIAGPKLRFQFRGKSGRRHVVDLSDRRLAQIVKRCRDLPGYELFQYIDDEGQRRAIDSSDVNAYLREIAGQDFSAKDFRTWAGTLLAALALQESGPCATQSQARQQIARAIDAVAQRLGNTPAICRKCYVHPTVIESYLDGTLLGGLAAPAEQADQGLRPEEAAVMALLRQRQARERAAAA